MVPIELKHPVFVFYSDASWANTENIHSQGGILIFLAEASALTPEGGNASLIEWASLRIRRVCRSTLSAEAQAHSAGWDRALFARALLAEMIDPSYDPARDGVPPSEFVPVHGATDCRSLYDILIKEASMAGIAEKRLAIDLVGIQE